jgi:predicted nucleic acid-binding protein
VGLIVVDASVFITLRDEHDAHHATAAGALGRARHGHEKLVLPVSAFAACLVRPFVAGYTEEEATADLLAVFTVEPLTREIAVEAARLRSTTKLRRPDAFVVATGIALDSDRILTCDRAWDGVDDRVHVLK